MHLARRKKTWIDRFQTALFWRIAIRFVWYQMMVWFSVLFGWYTHPRMTRMFGPEAAASVTWIVAGIVVFMGILFIFDTIKFCHRVVGPAVAFRRACKAIRDGEAIDLVRLRQGDFLQDLRDDFNDMLKALEQRGALTLGPASSKALGKELPRTPIAKPVVETKGDPADKSAVESPRKLRVIG